MKLYTLWHYDYEQTTLYAIYSTKEAAIEAFRADRRSNPRLGADHWRDYGIEVYVLDGDRSGETVTWEEMDGGTLVVAESRA